MAGPEGSPVDGTGVIEGESVVVSIDYLLATLESEELETIIRDAQNTGDIDTKELGIILSALDLGPDQLDDVYDWLETAGIEFLDPGEVGTSQKKKYTASQIIELAKRVERGDSGAKEEMILANTGLVVLIASGYQNKGLDFDDLIQEGYLGLFQAIEKFDWRQGNTFSTYARWPINQAIKRAVDDKSLTIRKPEHVMIRGRNLKRAEHGLRARLRRDPTLEEIAHEANIDPETARETLEAPEASVSMNALDDEKSEEFGDPFADKNNEDAAEKVTRQEQKAILLHSLHILNDRQRLVVEMRAGINGQAPKTLEAIGKLLGVTRERVRQIESRALEKLTKHMEEAEIEEEEEVVATHRWDGLVQELVLEEVELLDLMVRGFKNLRIAEELGIGGAVDVRKVKIDIAKRFSVEPEQLVEKAEEILKLAGERT